MEKNVENIILEAIQSKGLMQKFVSEKTNISETNLSLSLKGKRNFKSTEFIRLCLFLGLTLDDFKCINY